MRRALVMLLVVGLVFVSTGLVYSSSNTMGEFTPEGAVHQYGTTQSIIDHSKEFNSYILYPEIGIKKIDEEIKKWAENTYQSYRTKLMGERRRNTNIYGELNIQYNIYLINDRYLGIIIKGTYGTSAMAHPTDFVKTFNVDLKNERLLANEEIISKGKSVDVVALLERKLIEKYPDLESLMVNTLKVDRTWLMGLVLNHDSVDVILPESQYLPSFYGTVTISLLLDELKDAFLLTDYVKTKIDSNKPMVALTFDDGPSQYTEQILEILAKYGAHATFCMVGNRVETYANIVMKVKESGSEIVGHSWDHKNLANLSEQQIRKELKDTNDVIFKVVGVTPRFFRPPYGAIGSTLKVISKEMNLIALMWSVDPEDWRTRDADSIYEHIMRNVKDGSIILCHDLYKSTADAMKRVIPALIEQGYQLVTVSELLEHFQGLGNVDVFYSGHH